MLLTKCPLPGCMSLGKAKKGISERSHTAPWNNSASHRNPSGPLINSSGNRNTSGPLTNSSGNSSDISAWSAGEEGKEKGQTQFVAVDSLPVSAVLEAELGVAAVSSKGVGYTDSLWR